MQRAPEVGLKLVSDLEVVLVFTRADDAVARGIGDNVDSGPVREGGLEDSVDGVADADVAEEGEVARVRSRGRGRGLWLLLVRG